MNRYENIPKVGLKQYCVECNTPINNGTEAMEHHSKTGHIRFDRKKE